ncbi:Leucine-rich repeat protein [Legionella quinlivanii]|uniref:Leucine-rich repeat protein n=1 Tax=Legionella quinlivanii TaxID=45073 RepID=A0A0W0XSH4_9GAMM|nr:hypothetical protein [Legionella quinlivanii]KTD47406.1 Leucine-rich repeat protein [Legionella quinlivanii]SEG38305.1 hypothetical protein SAMN02746093_02742 [Legionella quinlivanii DSM 21216]STY10035.1 Leucine-rich repeat protein [Legionella quinlivanii]
MSCRFELSNSEPWNLFIEVSAELTFLPLEKEQNLQIIINALTSQFSHMRKVTLAGNGLMQFDYEEYVSILRALPKGLRNLDISANYLDRFNIEQLVFLGYVLPAQLRCIKANRNNLPTQLLVSFLNGLACNLPLLEQLDIRYNPLPSYNSFALVSIWQALPRTLRQLLADSVDLSEYPPEQIIELIPHYPLSLRSLHIDFCSGGWSAQLVFSLLRHLPPHLKKLIIAIPFPQSISQSMLEAWKTVPKHINEIEILDTSLQRDWISSLSVFIENLKVEKLNLAYNNLGLVEPADAVLLTRSISPSTKHLDLSNNQLLKSNIPFFFAGLSKGLKTLFLHGNGFERLSREELIAYFKFLPPGDIRIHFGKMKITPREFETSRYINYSPFLSTEPISNDSPIIGDPVHLSESINLLRHSFHCRFFKTKHNLVQPPKENTTEFTQCSSPTILMPSPKHPQSISWLQSR